MAKAGLEMLIRALATEQHPPGFHAITLRPGVMDIDMQVHARSQPTDVCPASRCSRVFQRDGRLVAPAVAASEIVARLAVGDVEHGRTYRYQEL